MILEPKYGSGVRGSVPISRLQRFKLSRALTLGVAPGFTFRAFGAEAEFA
jgi:hypothetical protein